MGDNLELHKLLGFTAYFLSNILCRFCDAPKDVKHQQVKQLEEFMRNEIKYENDLKDIQTNTSGIVKKTVFNEICGWSPVTNLYVDIMHDIILGSLSYDINFALYELVKGIPSGIFLIFIFI